MPKPCPSSWTEDAETITFQVRLPKVQVKQCAVVVSPFFLKVSQTPYLWEQDLLYEVDVDHALTSQRLGVNCVTIVLRKKEVKVWGDVRVQLDKV